MRHVENLIKIVRERDITPVELWTAAWGIFWGAFIGAPFSVFSSSAGYYLIALIPEPIWAFTAFFFGILQLWGLEHCHHKARRVASMGLMVMWSFVAGFLIAADWHYLSTVTYPMLTIGSFWVHWRLGPTAREVTRHVRSQPLY